MSPGTVAGRPSCWTGAVLAKLLPVVALVTAVLGGIYAGLFTPTEAGAVGSLFAFLLALGLRRARLRDLGGLLLACARTSAAILFVVSAAAAFGMMLTLSGLPGAVAATIATAGLGLTAYACGYLAVIVVLGMVLDSTSILLIAVPLALPAVQALGGDLLWFGIVTVIGVEIGLLTPPLGLSVYAIQSSLEDRTIGLRDIFVGALPFAGLMLGLSLVLILWPELARILP